MKDLHTLALVCALLATATSAVAQQKSAAKPTKEVPAVVAALPTLAVADSEQLLAAEQAYLGAYDCEFKQTLGVSKHQV